MGAQEPRVMEKIVCVLLLFHASLSLAEADRPPNFVFMMADDLGYGDLGYNDGTAQTPNLDAMASGPHSLRLDRYYSGGPVCSPTRGTVLTGRNHNRYCVWTANAGNNC
ncbi:N-acetylgalactosamine-6-sulfatase, partial [Geodia barretti]